MCAHFWDLARTSAGSYQVFLTLPSFHTNLPVVTLRSTGGDDPAAPFKSLKNALTSVPVLGHFVEGVAAEIRTHACSVGAFLAQTLDGVNRAISYASRTATKCERNYFIPEGETGLCLLVVFLTVYSLNRTLFEFIPPISSVGPIRPVPQRYRNRVTIPGESFPTVPAVSL